MNIVLKAMFVAVVRMDLLNGLSTQSICSFQMKKQKQEISEKLKLQSQSQVKAGYTGKLMIKTSNADSYLFILQSHRI